MGDWGNKWRFAVLAALFSATVHLGLLLAAPQITVGRLMGGRAAVSAEPPAAAPANRRLNVRLVDVRDRIFKIRNPNEDEARTAAVVGAELDQRARELFERLGLADKPKPEARLQGLGANVVLPKPSALAPPEPKAAPPVKIVEIDFRSLPPGRMSPGREQSPLLPRRELLPGAAVPGVAGGRGGAGEAVPLAMRLGALPAMPLRSSELASLQPQTPAPAARPIQDVLGLSTVSGRLEALVSVAITVYDPGAGEDGFFRLDIAPNPRAGRLPAVPKDVLFLVDCSGSISHHGLEGFREGLLSLLGGLDPQDRFNVVAFKDQSKPVFDEPQPVSPATIAAAQTAIAGYRRGGLTDVYSSLAPFVQEPPAPQQYRPLNVCLLSDGNSTVKNSLANDAFLRQVIKLRQNHVSVYTFSSGSQSNLFLLDLLAYGNRGASLHLNDEDAFAPAFATFMQQHAAILVADLRYRATGGLARDLFPRQLPHLYRGDTLSLYGRIPAGAEWLGMQITGRDANGGEQELVLRENLRQAPRGDSRIATDWAAQKIFCLIAERVYAPAPEQTAEIRRLADRYKLYVPYL
ncbi:MAG: VWA domain-containing protein [Lentisphaeria bacterium]